MATFQWRNWLIGKRDILTSLLFICKKQCQMICLELRWSPQCNLFHAQRIPIPTRFSISNEKSEITSTWGFSFSEITPKLMLLHPLLYLRGCGHIDVTRSKTFTIFHQSCCLCLLQHFFPTPDPDDHNDYGFTRNLGTEYCFRVPADNKPNYPRDGFPSIASRSF